MASLFSVPLELRQLIYEQLFSDYTIRHGYNHKSSQNRTALLQTCKQIYLEAWPFLPLNASFQFRGTEAMLDTLLSVDQAVVTRIRHIRVKAFPFPLYASGRGDYYSTYYFSNAMSLLPGLHLETLVVEDAFHGFGLVDGWRDVVTYFDIEALLQSDAWRELVYITPSTDFIASGYDHKRKRRAQPETWNMMLQERDGEKSGASVEMFLLPEKRILESAGERMLRPWSAKPGHEVIENFRIAGPDQDLKGEVRVVAKRGKMARYIQTGLSEKKTWQELKDKQGGFSPEGETSPHTPAGVRLMLIILLDWTPYYNDMADAVGWVYGGWGRRMQLAHMALNL